ncbi:MAG: glycosyltransferase [Desulfuromonadales bacterium]
MRHKKLRLIFYLNILLLVLLISYKIYLNFFEQDFESVHARQVEEVQAGLEGRSTYSFAVVGNINNSIGIFERKIIPQLNESGVDFVVSAGNAVSSGGEDKYRAIYRTLKRLDVPYLLTFGANEHSALGSFRFYDHFGPYLFAFSAGNSRFVFLDSTGKTSQQWQLRWLEEELSVGAEVENHFAFSGRPLKSVDRTGTWKLDDDYLFPAPSRQQLAALIEESRIDAVFSANLPLFSRQQNQGTEYIVTGGAGGLIANNEYSFYHYVKVDVDGADVEIAPVRLDIGQHPLFRTLESLWFFIHSVFYVGYLNFVLLVSLLVFIAIGLYFAVFRERNYYPDFDREIEPFPDRSLRVVMCTNNFLPFVGGVPISVERLRQGLKTIGHEVMVVAPAYPGTPSGSDTPDILRLPALPLFKKGDFPVVNIFSWRFYRRVKAFRPDVVHLHHPFWLGSAGLWIARRLKIPAVYTYHTRLEHYAHFVPLPGALFRNLIAHALVRHFANRCDAVVVPTESAGEYMRMIGVRRPIHVQPTGIDYKRLTRVDHEAVGNLRERLGIGDEKILVSVSRLSKEKNLDFLIDAVHRLRGQTSVPFKLLIIGEGPQSGHLRQRIEGLELEEHVVLVGAVAAGEMASYYHLADLFVFASRSETQGMVVLEAMAAGLPVVAVRSSGIDDLVENGFNGYKTRQDHGQWTEAVEKILAQPALRRQLADNARNYAGEYSIEAFSRQINRVYAQVLSARQEPEKATDSRPL